MAEVGSQELRCVSRREGKKEYGGRRRSHDADDGLCVLGLTGDLYRHRGVTPAPAELAVIVVAPAIGRAGAREAAGV